MPRARIQPTALSLGQLAERWSVSPDRVRALVESGKLPGAFRIPSAGKYGATVKVPLSVIEAVEQQWALSPAVSVGQLVSASRRDGSRRMVLKHFPQFNAAFPPDAESHEAAQH
jgi:hypothetical protein